MKKVLFMTAILSVALVGCVREDMTNPAEQAKQKITFDSPVMYSNISTRANVYGEIGSHVHGGQTYSYPQNENFIIYAVSHQGDFAGWENASKATFDATEVKYDLNVDGWAPKTSENGYYYWESGKKMSFAATSPADLEQENWGGAENRSYGATGLIIKDFEVNGDAAKHFDLLYSTRACNQTAADMNHAASYYSGIPIEFQHALSSIRFSISNTSDETVVLTGISLSGLKYKGTFKENIMENSTDYSLYDKSENGNVTPEWIVEDNVINQPYKAFTGSVPFLESAQYVSKRVEDLGVSTNVCHQLLVMPQELTDDVVLTVNYTVNGVANHKEVKLNGLFSGGDNVAEADKVSVSEWEIGKRYTYRLFYSSATADKDKIYFAPETDEWDDVDVIIVAL